MSHNTTRLYGSAHLYRSALFHYTGAAFFACIGCPILRLRLYEPFPSSFHHRYFPTGL
ncbi:hypothetical protein ISCGN_016126, partial [Ixodes scapularis]